MQCKFGKEKKLFIDDKFRVKYGTIDAIKLNAVYLNIESWVQPRDIENYDSYIRLMRRDIMLKIRDNIDKITFNENFIVDLDLRASGMSTDKKSFMFIELTVYPKEKIKFNSDLMFKKMQELSNLIIESLEKNKLNYFSKKSNAKSRRIL
jgi:hypothetical protein